MTHEIVGSRYVSFTTFRRNGEGVATAVWIADLGDGTAGFTTGASSGKVKRLRNDARVTLRRCDMRGRVPADADVVEARAMVVTGDDTEAYGRVVRAIRGKYGVQAWLVDLGGRLGDLVRRRHDNAAVVVRFGDAGA